ncbi:MAG: hypothetical protein GY820_25050 [Gammaproteobacteria bacterium]|nr:hypothetical protein [Gammaproteobacteria bacterium]
MALQYDYIIVGAGSAGCVLANRLSANGKHKVLILEAGGSDNKFWIQTPVGYGKTFYDPAVNWTYTTEADPGIGHRRSYWPRGKVLGGSSSINAMVYSGSEYRGTSGPLYINNVSSEYHPLCQDFLDAAKQYGFSYNPDFNGTTQEGVGYYEINTKNGKRVSAARAYLHPARRRPNCEVLSQAHVTGVLFENKQAIGVEYQRRGKSCIVTANREVILSAASINSPQILQLAGVGPQMLLRDNGIAVAQHAAAVGRNMQEHLACSYYYRSRVPTLNNQLRLWWGKMLAGMQYLLTRRGYVEINSADPFQAPRILQNYSSDHELIDDIRQRSSTIFHPTSTCMMGSDPAGAVVNSDCQVYGVDNLRVVDASIFPTVTSGNTNAPTIMVAEKTAAIILTDSMRHA